MQALVWLLLLFGLCFAVELAMYELRGRSPTLLTKARWLAGFVLVGYLAQRGLRRRLILAVRRGVFRTGRTALCRATKNNS